MKYLLCRSCLVPEVCLKPPVPSVSRTLELQLNFRVSVSLSHTLTHTLIDWETVTYAHKTKNASNMHHLFPFFCHIC